MTGIPAAATALLLHDLKNALGTFEDRLQARARALQDPELCALGQDCAALRHRMVQFLTLQAHPQGLRAHVEDEDPAEHLDRLGRCVRQQRPDLLVHQTSGALVPAFAHFDRHLVGMALDAALHNALRFARRQLWLHALDHDGGLLFRLDDDGPGPAATQRHTAHARTDAADPSQAPGRSAPDSEPDTEPMAWVDPAPSHSTGLGTALCAAVAQSHQLGGRSGWVRLGERPGGGARFELWLP
jgi:signal transduction histidine kinase